jgi:Na+/H+ antiporter NhaA
MAEAQTTPFTGRTAWGRNLAAPVRDFLSTESGSAAILLAAAVAALVWANSPWSDSYESLWTTKLSIQVGSAGISEDLRGWVNDGLMVFFFFVVGLEAKREFAMGELRERRRVATPVVAALVGMALPVSIYLVLNAGGPGGHGWGAAMSTDTAFALGALALLAPHATRLRVFMLTLVVVDDLVSLVIIGVAYSGHLDPVALVVAVGLFGAWLGVRYLPMWQRPPAAAFVGSALWVATFESGIHPTIAGLAMGFSISAYPPAREGLERATELARSFREQPTPELARSAQLGVQSAISPNERLQYRLHPWTSFVIVPLFALANAGIHVSGGLLDDALTSPVTMGIVIAYVVGKPLGILAGSWLSLRFGKQRAPVSWPVLAAGGAVAGIGFTVALLIASLAFHGRLLAEAKLGILAAAVLASVLSWCVIRVIAHLPTSLRARQVLKTDEDILDLARDVDPHRDHIRGAPDAPVTLVEYGDFECPYCGQAEPVIRELVSSFGADLRYVWRDLPLNDVHPHAQMAAEASEAAAARGKFWEMHDTLLAHQDALEPADLRRYAQDLGLDVDRFWDEVRRRVHAPRVAEDVASAEFSGVSGTPTFFVNGRRHWGAYDVATLSEVVRRAHARARLEHLDRSSEPVA